MTRQIGVFLLALVMMAVATPQPAAQAQRVAFGRGGLRYNGFGQGYYGGYRQGYTAFSPGSRTYSGYGSGPYLYGSQAAIPNRGIYRYGVRPFYNGYGNRVYGQYNSPYSTYGFTRRNGYGNRW